MDILWPNVRVNRVTPRTIDATARFVSALSGTVRTVSRPGDRWGFRLDYMGLQDLDRARIETAVAAQRGAANRILLSPIGHKVRGSFTCPELVPNGNFVSTSGWSYLNANLYAVDDLMVITNTSGGNQGQCQSGAIPTSSGSAYIARAIAAPGSQNTWVFAGGTTAGATDIFNLQMTDVGLASVGFIATTSSVYLTILCGSTVLGDSIIGVKVSLSRCMLVNGGSQMGNSLTVQKMPGTTNGVLLPGDWIAVGTELKRITAPVVADTSGNGTIVFSPPLRDVPNDSDPIAICSPFGRFILSQQENSWQVDPGYFGTVSLDFVEAP